MIANIDSKRRQRLTVDIDCMVYTAVRESLATQLRNKLYFDLISTNVSDAVLVYLMDFPASQANISLGCTVHLSVDSHLQCYEYIK